MIFDQVAEGVIGRCASTLDAVFEECGATNADKLALAAMIYSGVIQEVPPGRTKYEHTLWASSEMQAHIATASHAQLERRPR